MHARIIFESMFGNTQAIARALADGMASRMIVDTAEVGSAARSIGDDVDLLVVGGPTHAFGMSRPETRRSAAQRSSAGLVSRGVGVREWLAAVHQPAAPVAAAAFGTRIKRPPLPGSAARSAEKQLRHIGFRVLARAENFYVSDTEGPLLDGEVERARRWGETLAEQLATKTGDPRPESG